jgi:hypothetical protein
MSKALTLSLLKNIVESWAKGVWLILSGYCFEVVWMVLD